MNKENHIAYWQKSGERDWATVEVLFSGKQYMQSLFFAHLVIEKLLKANWVKDNDENTPPFSHNLELLYNQTDLNLKPELTDLFSLINSWNIEGRYQDYKDKFYQKCSFEYTSQKLNAVKILKECLLESLLKNI